MSVKSPQPPESGLLPPGGAPLTQRTIRRVSVVCFFAWVFSVFDHTLFGTLLPRISADYGWDAGTSTAVATWVTAGTFVVSLAVGPMLDRFGRKPTLMITTAGAALTSGLSALTGGKLSLILVRSFSGLGYSEEVVNSVYLNEVYGKRAKRGFMYSFVQSGWPVGALLGAALTAVFLPSIGWRGVFLFATLPAVLIVLLAWRIPESPVFVTMRHIRRLRAEGRTAEADATAAEAGIRDERTGTLRDVFAAGLRKHTLSLSAAWLLNWMAIQVFSVLGTTVLTEGKGVTFDNALVVLILGNAAGFAGYLTHGYVGDRLGRRTTIILGWLVGSVAMTAMLFGPAEPGFVIPMYALGLFFLLGPYAALLFYMGESFPPHVRGIGPNTAHIMGPVGAIIGSAMLSVLVGAGLSMTAAAFCAGSLGLLGSAIAMLGTRKVDQRSDGEAPGGDTPLATGTTP
ncbi:MULTISPECIES: MFS transporter [unclassified Streptomyces]|uniref:MFS transporter n=1 Tax=unclassified Streptomyces TaxID=2593676 RepID=UPI002DD95081|nr:MULTISPECIES: MFS transporter [unclassified Streptomyces]WSA90703.1 MFS transporter [Streptomyces sp. NBC_01795]WSB75027.1 MFS transporter [Streptomyces sp. NBC_01775]WSS16693.1 MFS transporter [Streptomyces sp. NBC_01186]WSS45511.1 MFS transporter [Streptomyces sp. NBC_01187]